MATRGYNYQLPDWFSLEKYNEAATLNAVGWYDQLSVRRYFREFIRHYKQAGLLLPENEQKTLLQLRSSPIVDEGFRSRKRFLSEGVSPVTEADFLQVFEPIIEGGHLAPAFTIKYPPYLKYLSVNLHLPDRLLIKEFRSWLATLRREPQYRAPRRRRLSFKVWVRAGVLPYIDLITWCEQESAHYPDRVLADAVFPSGDGDAENLRKTTTVLAESLLSDQMLQTLAALAASELPESKESVSVPES